MRLPLQKIWLPILVAIGLSSSLSVHAQTAAWAAASSGNWSTAGSWSPAAVPAAGSAVSLTIAGTYTVTYNSPMSAPSIASLTLGSSTAIPTLTITAAGFNVAGSCTFADTTAEVININSGGVMTNNVMNLTSRACLVNVNTGGILTNATTQVANNNSVDGATIFKINSGAIASLGDVTIGRHTESSSDGLIISGGTVTANSIAVGIRNSYATMAVSGGTLTNAGSLQIGTGTATAGREVRYTQTGGSVGCAGTVDLALASSYTTWFSVLNSGASFYASGIRIFPNSVSSAVARMTNSGNLYLGSTGLNVLNSGSYTVSLNDQGILGAAADWSGNANMLIPSGTATLRAADATGVAHNITLTGVISGAGSLAKTGDGTLLLYGADTYAGSTTVSAGLLGLQNASALPKGTALTLGGSGTAGTVDLNGYNVTLSGLNTGAGAVAGNQIITNGSSSSGLTLTFSNSAASSTYGGVIAGAKSIALTVLGGNLTLGGANTYGGNIFVSNGKLALGGAGSTFTGSAIVLSNSAAILDLTGMNTLSLGAGQSLSGYGIITGAVTAANCPLTAGTNGGGGTLTIAGGLTLNGNVTAQFDLLLDPSASGSDQINVSGAFNATGLNTILINPLAGSLSAGSYRLINYGSLGSGSVANFQISGSPGAGLQAVINVTANGIDLVVTHAGGAERDWLGDGSANAWDLTSTNWLNAGFPDIFTNGNFVVFNDAATNPVVYLSGALQPATVTVDSTNNYSFAGTGKISGVVVLTKTNTDTLTILTTNDYSGLTTIGQGIVQVGNGVTSGSLGSGPVVDNGQLVMQLPGNTVLGNAISGAGSLVQAGTAILTLSGSNTFSGGVSIGSGTLQVATGGLIGTGGITNNSVLWFSTTSNSPLSSVISGTGRLSLSGSGTVTLTGNNTFTGGVTATNGTLLVNNTLGSGTGSGAVTVLSGATLSGSGVLAGPVTINSGGILAPGNGIGTLSISNNLTVNSGAIVNYTLGSNSDRTVVAGNLNLNGTLNVTDGGGLVSATYALFTYTGSLVMGTFNLGTVPSGKLYAIDVSTPGQVNLIVGVVATNVPSFPGALGFGSAATGGRGGSVYHVTTLADTGAGSFRDAVSKSGRIIVFDVGGFVSLKSAVSAKSSLTIAGQTAPGGGIGFNGGEISFSGSTNIICRYIRIRPGSDTSSTGDDCLSLYLATNVIMDHVSLAFGPWNNIDAVTANNITVQNCIDANPTGQQFGAHTENVGANFSWFYNFFANTHNRNPLAKINTVFINNVLYNYQAGYTTHTSTRFKHDIVNNYFIMGPGSGGTDNTWFQVDNNQSIYASNNQEDSNKDGQLNGSTSGIYWYQGGGTVLTSPWSTWTTNVLVYTPNTAYRLAISQAGALPHDDVDTLVLNQAKTLGSGATGGGVGAGPGSGLYTSQAQTGLTNNGYGNITGGAPPVDSDGDGMPDFWESAVGLDSNNSNDGTNLTLSGYTQLEIYLNWLGGPHAYANSSVVSVDLSQYANGFTNVSPVYSVSAAVNGSVSLLPDGHTAQFSTASNFIGRASFNFAVAGNDGSRLTNTVGLVISATPPPQNLFWQGDGVANTWDAGTNANWSNGTNLAFFRTGDTVTFDDTGTNTPAINLSGTLKPSSLTVNASQNYTFSGSGTLSGTMSLVKSGSGTLTLNSVNNYGGGTLISAGTVTIGSGGDIGSGVITLDGGTLASTYGPTTSYNLAATINAASTGTVNLSPRMNLNGLSGSGVLNMTVPGTTFNYDNFQGSGFDSFAGTLNLTGTTSGASLTLNFNGGAFDGNLASATVNLDNVTLLGRHNSGGNTLTVGALNGTATASMGGTGFGGNEIIIDGGLNTDTTFAGSILNGTATTTFNKVGTGKLTLSGANNFSGGLNISNGTVLVNGTTTAGTVNVVSGKLGGSGSLGGPVTLQSGATLTPSGTFTINGALTLNTAKLNCDLANVTTAGGGGNDLVSLAGGALTLTGTSTIVPNFLNGSLANGTYTLISGGSGTTGSAANLAWGGPANARQVVAINTATPGSVLLNVSGTLPASLVWQGTNGGNWDLTTTNWLNGSLADRYFNSDAVTFNDTSVNGNVTVSTVLQPAAIVVSNTVTTYAFGGAAISGSASLAKYGGGTLVLSSSNSFSGGTVLNAGTILLTNVTANSYGLGSGSITLNGGTLSMYDNAVTANNATWNLIVPALATATLNADSRCDLFGSLTGAGILNFKVPSTQTTLHGDWSAFTGRINVTGGGEFRVLNFAGYPSAAIGVSSNVTVDFQGVVDPNGTTLGLGELSGPSSAQLLGGAATNGEVLTWTVGGANTDATFAGRISEQNTNASTTIQKVGTGAWTITGSNSYNGGTLVSQGKLLIGNTSGSAVGYGDVEAAAGATFGGTGAIAGSLFVDGGASFVPGSPTGTLAIGTDLSLDPAASLQFSLGASSSLVTVAGNLTLAGTLNVTSASGFGAGTYVLFNYSGNLSSPGLTLGTVPSGYSYVVDTSTTGLVKLVVTPKTPPTIGSIQTQGGSVVMSGTGGTDLGTFYLLGSTNLLLPLNQWTPLATNQFDGSGNFSLTNALPANVPSMFYLLQVP